MKLLLDTHVLLWMVSADGRLSTTARSAFENSANELCLSAASYWEIAIKISVGKLTLPTNWRQALDSELRRCAIRWMSITREHCEIVSTLEWHHRDPFDRMLIAQALTEKLTIVSGDSHFAHYEVPLIW